MGSERGLETRQQCGSIQETGSKSGLEMSCNVCPRGPSGREVTYSTGLRSTQAAEPEMSLETSTPTAQLRQGLTPLGHAEMGSVSWWARCRGESSGETGQGQQASGPCPQGFQGLVFYSRHQKSLLFLGTEKRLESFFLCVYKSLSDCYTFGCLSRIFTSEQIIPGVETSLP